MNVSSASSTSSMTMTSMKRPNSSKMTNDLFSSLDTKGKGYLDKNDLASVFSSDSFSKLDTNSNGKITKVEMKAALEKLAATLDAPLQTRLQGQMPPPPPQGAGQNDQGFTKDQLTSMSKETSSTDSTQSSTMSDIASNFDAADTNGDGKVTAQEAMTYENAKISKNSSNTSSTNASSSSSIATSSDAETKLMTQMIDLLKMMQDYVKPTDSVTKNNALLTSS